jgi:cobalamin synthase
MSKQEEITAKELTRRLEHAINTEIETHHKLQAELAELRQRNANERRLFAYEKAAVAKIPPTWFMFLLVHTVLMCVAFAKWSVVFFVANYALHILHWRRLYKKQIGGLWMISVAAIAASIFFMN